MQDGEICHFILVGEVSAKRAGIVKNCEERNELESKGGDILQKKL
jgi:hypothetical protein